ncbi:MAG: ATP-dependent Clp protease proteolytic subunit [Bacilli bacterium]|nr:ATP-dependent Clp protease proteolytic subunit [Bacilli bacterium]
MNLIPTVSHYINDKERVMDIYSLLLEERIIILNGEIDDNVAMNVVAQLLYLYNKNSSKDISLYINSPGGSITAGMAIYDTMNFIKCDVSTIGIGMCASMGAFLLSCGARGKRYALSNTEVMIHQPLGGAKGQVTDIEVVTKRLLTIKNKINKILASNTNKDINQISNDCERDYYMDAIEAKEYGLIDKVID